MVSRFGIAIVGPSAAGKTAAYTLLAHASTWLYFENNSAYQQQSSAAEHSSQQQYGNRYGATSEQVTHHDT